MAASYRKESILMKKILSAVLLAAIVVLNSAAIFADSTAPVNNQAAKTTAVVTEGVPSIKINQETGTISVTYLSNSDKIYKVLITKGDKNISYYLNNDGIEEVFPLQFGNGEYNVSVIENISGNKFKKIKSETVTLSLDDQNKVYLNSIQNIRWSEDSKAVVIARELTRGLKTDKEKITAVYNYIVNNFSYDFDKLGKLSNDYVPDIDKFTESKKGICYDYSSTFAAMLRSLGIPTKLVKGYAEGIDGYHAWNEVYDKETKKWTTIDTTYDSQMRADKSKYSMVKDAAKYSKVNEY